MLKAKVKIEILKNKNSVLNKIKKQVAKSPINTFKVGILSEEERHSKSGKTLQELANILNKGCCHIPPRPYNSLARVQSIDIIKNYVNTGEVNVLNYYDKFETVLIEKLLSNYKKIIIEFDTPGNAPLTIAKKGFNDPLIETKEFLKAVEVQFNDNKKIGKGRES